MGMGFFAAPADGPTYEETYMYISMYGTVCQRYMFIWYAYTCSTNMRLIMPEDGDLSVSLPVFPCFPAKA